VLSGKCLGSVMGSDINKLAIENAEINAEKFGVKA
jgi:methylase of polypeptide subunit release factors